MRAPGFAQADHRDQDRVSRDPARGDGASAGGAKGARDGGKESAVRSAVRLLREEIVGAEAGVRLGTEDEVLARFGFSRPTLRQAARILEHEQFLEVRRGSSGGLYGRRPNIDSVTQAISLFLHQQSATFNNVIAVSNLLLVESTRLAALAPEGPGKDKLRDVFEHLRERESVRVDVGEFLKDEGELFDGVVSITGNPVLELLQRALYQYSIYYTNSRVFQDQPLRRKSWRQGRLQAVEAILAGDVEVATLFARRLGELISTWVSEDEAEAGKPL